MTDAEVMRLQNELQLLATRVRQAGKRYGELVAAVNQCEREREVAVMHLAASAVLILDDDHFSTREAMLKAFAELS